MNYIGVIDCNNFFVSCERLFRPDLVGRPVVVLSSNDGCVVARSQEVKDMGIMMGVPIFQIKDIIKDKSITTFSSHFTLYRDISSRVFSVVEKLLPGREIYSIDEAFFTIKADSKIELAERLRYIKLEVERQVGIPVSLGVAATKTQAKYANRVAKKSGGVCVLDDADWVALTEAIPLQNIWGVGGKMELRYKAAGLLTVADLIAAPKLRVEKLFGIVGLRLQAELSGQSVYLVLNHHEPQKSIMSSRSFAHNVTDLAVVKDAVAYHTRQVVADLRHLRLKAGHIAVILGTSRHGDYVLQGGSLMTENTVPIDDVVVLLKQAWAMVDQLFNSGVPYKKAGVYIGNFTPVSVAQQSLFIHDDQAHTQPISELVESINALYGDDFMTIGKHTCGNDWQSKSEQKSPAYTTRWGDLATVVAK